MATVKSAAAVLFGSGPARTLEAGLTVMLERHRDEIELCARAAAGGASGHEVLAVDVESAERIGRHIHRF